jgi:predicted ATPase
MDYISICETFAVVFVEGVTNLSSVRHNETRRFIVFIDCAYERCVKLVITADLPIESLFIISDSETTEERAVDLRVVAEGGASGNSTTMLGHIEWSATGRTGVSLADLVGQRDVEFAYRRAISRLREMQSQEYLARHAAIVAGVPREKHS